MPEPRAFALAAAILGDIATTYGVSVERLKSHERSRTLTEARGIFAGIALKRTRLSVAEVGRMLNRDHATVHYWRRRVNGAAEAYEAEQLDEKPEDLEYAAWLLGRTA